MDFKIKVQRALVPNKKSDKKVALLILKNHIDIEGDHDSPTNPHVLLK